MYIRQENYWSCRTRFKALIKGPRVCNMFGLRAEDCLLAVHLCWCLISLFHPTTLPPPICIVCGGGGGGGGGKAAVLYIYERDNTTQFPTRALSSISVW